MTNDKTWRLHPDGPRLGTTTIISPWTGGPTEAVVNLDNNMVIAAHGATCQPFFLNVPEEIFKGELREAPGASLFYGDGQKPEMGLITLLTDEERQQIAEDAEPEPHALTEDALPVMEAWIRKRGYAPFTDTDTGKVVILCTECMKEECKCPIPF